MSLSAGQPWRRLAAILSVALVVSGSQLQPAHAETSAPTVPAARVVATTQPEAGASADEQAIADAAESYESGNAKAAAALADAASAADALPMVKTKDGLALETDDGTAVEVAKDGDVTLSAPGMPEIGLSVAGDPEQTKVVGGALVQTEVAPSTDVVTRATENGVQVVAVLADSKAPTTVDFSLDLPKDAKLITQNDGSVSVVAPVKVETVSPQESEAYLERVESIVGDAADPDDLTSGQIAAVGLLQPPLVSTETTNKQIAVVDPAWAVDANGAPVATHYEVVGGSISQVIDTNATTAFPVTADPEVHPWWWWAWTATNCVANVVTLFSLSAIVFAKIITKVSDLVKKSARIAALIEKIGGVPKFFTALKAAAKGLLEGKVGKYLSPTQLTALIGLSDLALNTIADIAGVGSCYSLIRAAL